MAAPSILSATGDYLLLSQGERTGPGPTILTIVGTSWTGSLVLKINTAYPGEAVSLSNVAYKNRATGISVAAGTAITSDLVVEVGQLQADLYATYTHTSGSVEIRKFPAPMNSAVANPLDIDVATADTLSFDTTLQSTTANKFSVAAASGNTVIGGTIAAADTITSGASGAAITALKGTAKSGTDQAAGALSIVGNLSTGAGAVAPITFKTGQILGTGTTVQTAASMWSMKGGATTATAELVAEQVTARIVGGSTNGLAIRNSANARDNLLLGDAGDTCILSDGTRSIRMANGSSANGELPISGRLYNGQANGNTAIMGNGGSTSGSLVLAYYNGTQFYSAAEISHVASGFGTLALMKSGGYVSEWGSTAGGGDASSRTKFRKAVTAFTDTVAKSIFTVTIPNAAHAACVRVTVVASLGAGGAVGAGESMHSISYDISFVRTAGVNAVAVASSAFGSAAAGVAGSQATTAAVSLAAVVGAVGATNTIDIQATITRGGAGADNHTALCFAEVLNTAATGITIA